MSNTLKPLLKTESGFNKLTGILATIASYFMFVLMALTVSDVVGRYFFNKPIPGNVELVGMLVVIAGTWGLAYCQVHKHHIRASFIMDRTAPMVQQVINAVSYLFGLFAFSMVVWQTVVLFNKYYSKNFLTNDLDMPIYPFIACLILSTAMMAVALLIDFIRSINSLFNFDKENIR